MAAIIQSSSHFSQAFQRGEPAAPRLSNPETDQQNQDERSQKAPRTITTSTLNLRTAGMSSSVWITIEETVAIAKNGFSLAELAH